MNFPPLVLFVSLALPTTSDLSANLAADEQTLTKANLSPNGPALLDFFRKRIPSSANDAAVAPLIKQLSDKDAAGHAKASGNLVALGPAALKQLRQAANRLADPEAAARARQCLQMIEGSAGAAVVSAAAHLLAFYKPEGAAAALIDYYPFADDESVMREIDAALVQVAVHDGQLDAALLRALHDEAACRRHAAAAALCKAGGASAHDRVRPLLKDPKPSVRFLVALSLAEGHDASVLPILIDQLAELSPGHRKQAEEWLSDLAGDWAVKAPQGNDATSRRLRRDLWLAWWNSIDNKQLLQEFQSRTLTDQEHQQVLALVKQFDQAAPEKRERVMQELVAWGPKVVPLLRQASQQSDPSVGTLLHQCIGLIEKGTPNPLPSTAARLLALRRPEGTLETLLAFLPFADNSVLADEIGDLIMSLGIRDGKPAPLLVKALTDPLPARRALAAVALCRTNSPEQLAAVHKLLQDADPQVRWRTAQVLAEKGQREAIPVLIALLKDLPLPQAYEIEDYLAHLAADKSPQVPPLAADPAARAKACDLWNNWWKEHGKTIDLAKFDPAQRMLGLTLVVEMFDPATRQGRVVELDKAGKIRWKVEGLTYPTDAQIVPGQRVLIAEQNAGRVTERDLSGKILWQQNGLAQPFVVQRQRNGNTFIGCRNMLIEVNRRGKQVFSLSRPNEYLLAATKFRDGQMAYVNNEGQYIRVDANGKEVKSYTIPFNPNFGMNNAEILPNDNVLVSEQAVGKVIEYSPDGKTVWEASIQHSGTPHRLANGHTLVTNANSRRIVELDRNGKIVSEMKELPVRPSHVSRR